MTDIVTIPDVLPISPYPALGSTNFNNEAYAYATSVPPAVSRMREIAIACWTNATAAQERANSAAGSASGASGSASAAAGSASAASGSASAAASSASTASSAAGMATTALTAMQVMYLGSKAVTSHPTTDNMGNPLQAGALYTNTGTNAALNKRGWWWDGAAWQLAWGDITGVYMPTTGGTFTGHINVPANATGSQAPRASEVTSRTTASFDHNTPMSAAPYNQWSFFTSGVAAGSDWPPGHSSTNAWNVITCGFATRATQYATQDIDIGAGLQGWTFTRSLHDTTWSPWSRVVTDTSFIERVVTATASGGTYAPDPKSGTVHQVTVTAACTISPVAPRLGDQLTVKVQFSGGAWPLTFAASVKPPTGSAPTYAAGQILPLIFECSRAGIWDLSYGQVRAV
ncbi:hypothetical protein [Delftia tsuruhatensis]|uniref:hypothetical protein n=1 Tax=Delftia tsuruhatensis TaxID=180282 RepID=UPI002595C709|nr:hypothetical protein [uncultured Delftia sp.]